MNTTHSWDVPYTEAHVFKYITLYSNAIAASDRPFPENTQLKKENLQKFRYHGKRITEYEDEQLKEIIDQLAACDLKNIRTQMLDTKEFAFLITDDNLASEFKTRKKIVSISRNWYQFLAPRP